MLTEKDEFIYHEMMAHVPMAVHPKVENVLVIGGGDGGCVRELAKYNTIQKIDVVEVDPLLVEVCRKYFPQIASSLDDDRVTIYNEDGLRFVRSRSNVYDRFSKSVWSCGGIVYKGILRQLLQCPA